MTQPYVVYDDLGTIRQLSQIDAVHFAELSDNAGMFFPGLRVVAIEAWPTDPKAFLLGAYVDVTAAAIAPRRAMAIVADRDTIVADGVDTLVLSGLPQPSSVMISGAVIAGPIIVDDGRLELTTDHPGDVTITVNTANPSYLTWSTVVHAT